MIGKKARGRAKYHGGSECILVEFPVLAFSQYKNVVLEDPPIFKIWENAIF